MELDSFVRYVTISNEYVSVANKQVESRNHGQSKIKFKGWSNFFNGFKKVAKQNKLGDNETHDNYSLVGEICFYKKHVIQFFENIKVIYEKHADDYANINVEHWSKYLNKFLELYKDYDDNDLIVEELTTTTYRYHEQALVFDLYQNILFHVAIPYACRLTFYKVIDKARLLVIPSVDFALLETSYFVKLSKFKDKEHKSLEARVRKFQARYRSQLLTRDGKCILSNVETESTLEGAHLKPYSVSNQREQSDSMNGILLTATFHRFLENGMISFDPETGKLLLSKYLPKNDEEWIRKNTNKFTSLRNVLSKYYDKMKPYIKYHYKHIFIA